MTKDRWKTDIYEPYLETWKIIKILQEAYNKPQLFQQYIDEVQSFAEEYAGNEFAELLRAKLFPFHPLISILHLLSADSELFTVS